MKASFAFSCCMLTVIAMSVVDAGFEARAEWRSADIRADWTGRDFACSPGPVPKNEFCNAATRGLVAVCWASRRTGECNNALTWCTYKKVTLQTRPDGAAAGDVYVCR